MEASELMQVRLGPANAVDVVRKRIQQILDRKGIMGEQNTEVAVIDPIFIALSRSRALSHSSRCQKCPGAVHFAKGVSAVSFILIPKPHQSGILFSFAASSCAGVVIQRRS